MAKANNKRKVIVITTNIGGCWLWGGGQLRSGNLRYGAAWDAHRKRRGSAHRILWEALNGLVPTGLQLDHLCRNTLCCNPTHLEPVTAKVNIQRGIRSTRATCRWGHPRTPANTYRRPDGRIAFCRVCAKQRVSARRITIRRK